mgnify:CR=1 FL=1
MKTIYKKILPCILAFEILIVSFFSYSIPVNAADFMPNDIVQAVEYGIEYNDWEPFYRFLYNSADGLMYLVSQMGAVTTKDFQTWVDNNKKLESLVETVPAKKEGENIVFTKELMTQLKTILDDYAKEHEPYYMVNTLTLDNFLGSSYPGNKLMYDTAKNLLEDSPSGVIAFGAYYSSPTNMYFVDIGNHFKNISAVNNSLSKATVTFYDNETWGQRAFVAYGLNLALDGEAIKTSGEFKEKATSKMDYGTYYEYPIGYSFYVYPDGRTPGTYPYDCRGAGSNLNLVTRERRRIRVFNTYGDFQNYTLGKRSVYYTKDYYSYVPEDLTTSIDDLQQTVDDLSGVIDKLLGQITDITDESEIEDLLKQILDELKNNQGGGGGGGGSGGGDVNVDIDLSSTNTLLSKILAKVTQIFDRMNTAVGDAEQAAFAKIQESLDEIVEQLKKIKRWTAVDTVIDGVDAIADWLDLVRGVLKDAKEGAGSAVAALSSAVGDSVDLMSKKFPFSIPWDVLFLVSVLSAEPQMPYFEIPFNIESSMLGITIDYTMELDFSQFQWLSDLSRLILSMTYAVGLMKTTFGVTSVGKEE